MNDEKQNREAKENEKGGGCMIKGFVQGQTLKLAQTRVVADTIDYLIAKFHFQGEDWRGLEKWMHLQQGEQLYLIKLANDRTKKSDHLNLGAGEWAVWLHGNENVNGSVIQRITTNICTFTVERSGALEGDAMPELPASVAEQLDARINAIERQDGTLPIIGEADEGKVLTVVSGVWQAAKAPVGGGSITVDDELSETSENPVQNKVLTQAFNQAMTEISGAMEEMGKAIENAGVTVDSELSATSENPVQNKVIAQVVEEAITAVSQLGGAVNLLGERVLPEVTAEDNGKFLQVVGGAWSKVAIADSSIKTYIDDYINEALGGDY